MGIGMAVIAVAFVALPLVRPTLTLSCMPLPWGFQEAS